MYKLWRVAVSTAQLPNVSMNCLKCCVWLACGGKRRISFLAYPLPWQDVKMQTNRVSLKRTLVNFKSTLVCLPVRNLDGQYRRQHLSVCHNLLTRIQSDDVHHSDFLSATLRLPDETLALPMSPQSKTNGGSKGFLSRMHLHDHMARDGHLTSPCVSKPVAKNTWLKSDTVLRISDAQRGMDQTR